MLRTSVIALTLAASGFACSPQQAAPDQDTKKFIIGKWALVSDKPSEKDTVEVTPEKWVWNNPAFQPSTITHTYTIADGYLVTKTVNSTPSSTIKSRIQIADDVMTLTLRKEDHKHLWGGETGEVVSRYKRIK